VTKQAHLLEATGVTAGYVPDVDILRDLHLYVDEGELVSVVGPNGAGKSTLIKAIFGLVRIREGSIRLDGEEISGLAPHRIARRGMRYVPQLDNVFPSLTVEENLDLAVAGLEKEELRSRREAVYELFSPLAPARGRQAGLLSGGQRQMLAMARALMPRPQVLLLDEPSAGLAPEYVTLVFEKIVEIRNAGVTVLVVEQNARRSLALSDRGYVLELGRNVFEGRREELLNNETVVELYLGRRAKAEAE
jgi:ABC-type branched-subunit amino acid transport system ATPase component